MTTQTALIEQVRKYMEEKKMSQARFAKAVDTSESTISRWLQNDYLNAENVNIKVMAF